MTKKQTHGNVASLLTELDQMLYHSAYLENPAFQFDYEEFRSSVLQEGNYCQIDVSIPMTCVYYQDVTKPDEQKIFLCTEGLKDIYFITKKEHYQARKYSGMLGTAVTAIVSAPSISEFEPFFPKERIK